MIKKLFVVSSLCLALVISPYGKVINPDAVAVTEAKTYVYYVPGSSYAYHTNRSCRTLKRSKHVKKTALRKAKNKLGLSACKVC